MLGVFVHYIPSFYTYNKQKQFDIILNGFDKDIGIFLLPMFYCNMLFKTSLLKQRGSLHLLELLFMFIPPHPHSYPSPSLKTN